MESSQFDLVIVGGGLAGSLLLNALQVRHPHLRYLLIEKSGRLGGNQTWSFHNADISDSARSWLQPLITKSWKEYEVDFPDYSRSFETPYHCLTPDDLEDKIWTKYPRSIRLNEKVLDIKMGDTCEITLQSGHTISAESVVFARGWDMPEEPVAWQKFVRLDVELSEPHGLDHVVLMDASVQQIDGFRCFSILPMSDKRLIVEDAYYSHHTGLKVDRIEQEILGYLEKRGWRLSKINRKEKGILPLIMDIPKKLHEEHPQIPRIGAESGFFHPVTGYTVPTLLRQIDAITEHSNLTMSSIKKALSKVEIDAKSRLKHYRILNRMLFRAAEPLERYKVLSHFYKMPESLIQRFYAGETNLFDQLRMMMGKPPVPIRKAYHVLKQQA